MLRTDHVASPTCFLLTVRLILLFFTMLCVLLFPNSLFTTLSSYYADPLYSIFESTLNVNVQLHYRLQDVTTYVAPPLPSFVRIVIALLYA